MQRRFGGNDVSTLEELLNLQPIGSPVGGTDAVTLIGGKNAAGDRGPALLDGDAVKVSARQRQFSTLGDLLTRPNNTTTYAGGDSISNDPTAANVTPLTVSVTTINDEPVNITQIVLDSTDTGFAAATIRLHLFSSDPTASSGVGAGDNSPWTQKRGDWMGSLSGSLIGFSDGAKGLLYPDGPPVIIAPVESGGVRLWWQLQLLGVSPVPSAGQTTFRPTFKGYRGLL